VTGTSGKSTVSWILRWILQSTGRTCGLLGTVRYLVGDRSLPAGLTTPPPPELQQLLAGMIRAGSTHVVMEASSHALDQKRLRGLMFKVGIFTNLTRDHLDYHGNMEDYGRVKISFFHDLLDPAQGTAILNADDPLCDKLTRTFPGRIITYGTEQAADLKANRICLKPSGSSFTLRHEKGENEVNVPFPGRFNVDNTLAALGGCLALGISLDAAIKLVEKIPPIPGRMELVNGGEREFRVMIDFAHTPDALTNALNSLREILSGRLILVFGCGGDRDSSKRPLMGKIADQLADYTIITSDNPRSEDPAAIIAEIAAGFNKTRDNHTTQVDRATAIHQAISMARRDDIVLIAGKGHEEQQVFLDYAIPFSDRWVAETAMDEIREIGP